MTAHPWPRRTLAVALALAVPFATQHIAPPSAYAGPDDTKTTMYQGHIDSPKVFWDAQAKTFSLKSKLDANDLRPVADTVTWLPPFEDGGKPQHLRTISDEPHESFLGQPGQILHWAQATPPKPRKMLWQGLGADTDVPVESFRDHSFQLDLVDFAGPGRMTMWTDGQGWAPTRVLLASHGSDHRSFFLKAGEHTHNETTFTKPGRYEMTMAASARGADGTLITTEPRPVVWQVGGTKPNKDGIGDVRAAYEAAAGRGAGADQGEQAGTAATANEVAAAPEDSVASPATGQPSLSISPAEGAAGQHSSTLRFDAGNNGASGTAVFYIDGFFLAEVPVSEGAAEWTEMLGGGESSYQVVFIPNEASATERWISPALDYEGTGASSPSGSARTSGKGAAAQGEFPTPRPREVVPSLQRTSFTPTSPEVEITTSADSNTEEYNLLTVTPKDNSLSLHVTGGLYESGAEHPTCRVNFTSVPGARSTEYEERCGEGASDPKDYEWRLTATPVAWSELGAGTLSARQGDPRVGEANHLREATITLGRATDKPAEQPSPKGTENTAETVTLNQGHVDIRPEIKGNQLHIRIGDDTRQHATGAVSRDPRDVTLEVSPLAKNTRAKLGKAAQSPEYDFLGEVDQALWILPQVQDERLVWPGFSTEELGPEAFPEGADFEIAPDTAPEGGRWVAYTTSIHGPNIIADSKGTHRYKNPRHSHLNWVFTAPGTYTIKVRALPGEGTAAEYAKASDWETITFTVLDKEGAAPEKPNQAKPGSDGNKPISNEGAATGSSTGGWWKALLGVLGILGGFGVLALLAPTWAKFLG